VTVVSASIEQARAAKAKLTEQLAGHPIVAGVGLARAEEGWRIKINVTRGGPEPAVPDQVDGVPVTVEVVGRIAAQ
jgi:hypothetical protein